MNIVVDASIFMSIILNEPEKQKIITLTDGATVCTPMMRVIWNWQPDYPCHY
jgi:hypothetical protein